MVQMKDTKGATERKQQVNYKQQQKILQVVTDRCSFFYPPLVKDISLSDHQCPTGRLVMLYDVAGSELGYGVSRMSRVSQ